MAAPDPVLTQIATRFDHLDVTKRAGGYTLTNHRGTPVARLKPFPRAEGFELFYWSNPRQCWRTFGPLGPFRLSLDEALQILETEPIFRLARRGWLRRIFR